MRVVQVLDRLRIVGGAERLQVSFAEAVQDRPVDVHIVTLGKDDPQMVELLAELGVGVTSFPARRFASPARAARVIRFIREGGFDLVHTHLVRSTILGSLAGRVVGLPVVTTLHNTRPSHRLPRYLLHAEGWVLRNQVSRIIAVGWLTREAHTARLASRPIEVIPNAVPAFDPAWAEQREEVRRSFGVSGDEPVLVSVGRLQPQKAYPDLIEAFRLARREREDLRLWIVGGGWQQDEIEPLVHDPSLEGRVQLLGRRDDVPRILAAADLYVSAAHWEGLPVSILEAMSAGLGIVATEVGDVSRIVDDRNGALVPPGNPPALAAAISSAIADPSRVRAWGEVGAKRAEQEFGLAAWADQIAQVYEEALLSGS